MKILDQGRDRLVEHWQSNFHLLKDVPDAGMVVPGKGFLAGDVGEVDRDEPDSGLNQATRQQATLADHVAAETIAEPGVLATEVECLASRRASSKSRACC